VTDKTNGSFFFATKSSQRKNRALIFLLPDTANGPAIHLPMAQLFIIRRRGIRVPAKPHAEIITDRNLYRRAGGENERNRAHIAAAGLTIFRSNP